jgi:lipoyl(octanoyl) transferase
VSAAAAPSSASAHEVWQLDLGVEPYDRVHALQLQLVEWRHAGLIPDVLMLLEHEPVITLGRRGEESNILAPAELLAREGIAVERVERGGDVTYHGPGQLVAYPILRLEDYHLGPSDYMHGLEQVIRDALAGYGLETHLREGIIGVWVGRNKIAALGVRIRRGISFHGLALNVAPNMTHWSYIIACGITDGGVTSLAAELPAPPPMADVRRRLAAAFAARWHVELRPATLDDLRRLAPEPLAVD